MKKIMLAFISSILMCTCAYAGGGVTHMFAASETINKIPNSQVRNLIRRNIDAYLVGAWYPDSGYAEGNTYGESSHHDKFMFTFIDHLNTKYKDPVRQNPRLVAFLLGCASHIETDRVLHSVFYYESAAHDFHGNWQTAQDYGDIGLDFIVNMEKGQWRNYPRHWWVPVADLTAIYKKMGYKTNNANQIIHGNKILAAAGIETRTAAAPAYPFLRYWKMPWTATHYYNNAKGSLVNAEHSTAQYQMKLWKRLVSGRTDNAKTVATANKKTLTPTSNPLYKLGKKAVDSGAMLISTHQNRDGSVNFDYPLVKKYNFLKSAVAQLINWVRSHV